MLAPKRIYVLLINAGTANEGIHTLQMGGRNKVLMFESEDDAMRYALMLEAQDFPAPSVEAFGSDEIEDFCRDAGYDCELVETGRLELPPENNVERTDWQSETQAAETPATETADETDLSDSELEAIRRRLEGLL
ncbi:MAG: DUF3110 domain-containing protein [Cyanobacteriota bacterium]|nr:DUF3110 domain-containing protein [Cyanobacteriota bacterium]